VEAVPLLGATHSEKKSIRKCNPVPKDILKYRLDCVPAKLTGLAESASSGRDKSKIELCDFQYGNRPQYRLKGLGLLKWIEMGVVAASFTGLSAQGLAAQPVLERVLSQIENATNLAPVNGTYANIAESVSQPAVYTSQTVAMTLEYAPPETVLYELGEDHRITAGDIGTTFTPGDGTDIGDRLAQLSIDSITVNADGSLDIFAVQATSFTMYNVSTDQLYMPYSPVDATIAPATDALVYSNGEPVTLFYSNGVWPVLLSPSVAPTFGFGDPLTAEVSTLISPAVFTAIEGSINNTVTGVVEATAVALAGVTSATDSIVPTLDFGDMATTALGAVNTGDIVLGVNSAIDEAETTYTNAIYAALTQIGGSVDTGAVVINVASNMSAVDGSITNVMSQVNGTIGNLSTTALGAVNTGTITSGVDAAVQGIVGISGQ
jgi:hypothetical protein